jgi:uncharacterized membrane protein YebE (DUF533 family)
MANYSDLIGAFLQNASAPSGQGRMGRALEDLQRGSAPGAGGAPGGGLADLFGGGAGGGVGGLLGGLLQGAQRGLGEAARDPVKAGGLGALAGALLGGGGDSIKGAIGGGALAMLAGVAVKALLSGGQTGAGAYSAGALPLGLKAPEGPAERQALERNAQLLLRGMISAAKADGDIDQQEMQRIVGRLKDAGMDAEAQAWVLGELSRPLDLDALVADIPNPELAAEVYAASLLAVEVDTPAERDYLARLAQRTGLQPAVVRQIHQSMGVPVA